MANNPVTLPPPSSSWRLFSSDHFDLHSLTVVAGKVAYLVLTGVIMPWFNLGAVQPLVAAAISLIAASLLMHQISVYDSSFAATLNNKLEQVTGSFFESHYLRWGIPPLTCAIALLSQPVGIALGIVYGITQGMRMGPEAAHLASRDCETIS